MRPPEIPISFSKKGTVTVRPPRWFFRGVYIFIHVQSDGNHAQGCTESRIVVTHDTWGVLAFFGVTEHDVPSRTEAEFMNINFR